jgi:uncharacterized membrane protein YdbT with pleckstrin-like domain
MCSHKGVDMAFTLKNGETVKLESQIHWSAYWLTGAWALFMSIPIFAMVNTGVQLESILIVGGISYGPFIHTWLRNKTKRYIVTNLRLYVEEGIISRTITDIPLNKINDTALSQGLVQRMFGSADLSVMTGNHKPTILKDIDCGEQFKSYLVAPDLEKAG